MNSAMREARDAIRSLLELEDLGKADSDEWYDVVSRLQELVRSSPQLEAVMGHVVWHYTADADVRKKDSEYALLQRKQVGEVVEAIERETA